jgi:hypothetical protein
MIDLPLTRDPPAGPPRHPFEHLERQGAAGQRVRVEQPGHDLVHRVPGRPHRLPGAAAVEELLRERAQVPVAERPLTIALMQASLSQISITNRTNGRCCEKVA